jgi:hypothetical protein
MLRRYVMERPAFASVGLTQNAATAAYFFSASIRLNLSISCGTNCAR